MEDKNKEQVEHPNHYNKGIEMWDYSHSHDLDFFEGNVVKYVTRWRHKNGLQDLEKALMYLNKLIELEKKRKIIDTVIGDEHVSMDIETDLFKEMLNGYF